MASIESLASELAELRSEVKALLKLTRKIRATQEDPSGEKAESRSKNNGFNRLIDVSDELRAFFGMEPGQQISRSQVTKDINKYITENNLKHAENKRVILLDDKLRALLKPPADIQVTFLNIQRYLSPHYVKPLTVEAPVQETETTATPVVPVKPVVAKRPLVKKAVKA
jgi:upstream activation factor subunit UAF30